MSSPRIWICHIFKSFISYPNIVIAWNKYHFYWTPYYIPWLEESAHYSGIKIINILWYGLRIYVNKCNPFKAGSGRHMDNPNPLLTIPILKYNSQYFYCICSYVSDIFACMYACMHAFMNVYVCMYVWIRVCTNFWT